MNKLYNDTAVQAIANAIRAKNGSSDTYTISEMSTALNDISYYAKPTISNVALATFEADGLPLNKLKVGINAVQSGSGEPSPTNIRPISGWDAANVSDVGKNLVNPDTLEIGYYNNNGEKIDDNHYRMSALISAKSNTVYTTSLFVKDTKEYAGGLVTTCWDVNKNIINQYTSPSFTTPPNTAYIRVRNFQSDTSYIMNDNFIYQLEEGSTASDFVAYNGSTTTISLPQTVYGGELDVVNGVLTITHEYIASYNGETLPSTWISDRDVYAEGTSPTTGAEVCYERANPISTNLTPTLIKSLNGQNNLSVDCGDVIELEYFKEV